MSIWKSLSRMMAESSAAALPCSVMVDEAGVLVLRTWSWTRKTGTTIPAVTSLVGSCFSAVCVICEGI